MTRGDTAARARAWGEVAAVTAVTTAVLALLGLTSPVLFGALAGGVAHGLRSPGRLAVPPTVFRGGQALIGATIGAQVTGDALRGIADDAVPIALVTLGTLVLSLAAGRTLALRRDVSTVTGAFALVAGGASGVVAVSRELGADERVVTVVQYLRVLVVLLAMPVVTALVFQPDLGQGSLGERGGSLPADLTLVVASVATALLLARLFPVPTVALLGALVVAAGLASAEVLGPVAVPRGAQWLGFLVIGVQVGLRFTRESVGSIARMLPAVLGLVMLLILLCASLGVVLATATAVDPLTAYLATTPGGLFAVLATAADAGVDVTFVLALQLFRLLVILALLPLVARLGRGRAARGAARDT